MLRKETTEKRLGKRGEQCCNIRRKYVERLKQEKGEVKQFESIARRNPERIGRRESSILM